MLTQHSGSPLRKIKSVQHITQPLYTDYPLHSRLITDKQRDLDDTLTKKIIPRTTSHNKRHHSTHSQTGHMYKEVDDTKPFCIPEDGGKTPKKSPFWSPGLRRHMEVQGLQHSKTHDKLSSQTSDSFVFMAPKGDKSKKKSHSLNKYPPMPVEVKDVQSSTQHTVRMKRYFPDHDARKTKVSTYVN